MQSLLTWRQAIPCAPGRHVLPLLIALAVLASEGFAQSLAHGSLTGAVRDSSGNLVSNAEVRIIERASGAVRTKITARDGAFRFEMLTPASYDIAVEALGFRPALHTEVGVLAGAQTSVRITLRGQAPPVTAIDTVQSVGTRPAPLAWLFDRGYAEVSGARGLLSDVASASPMADAWSIEGLDWRHAELMVDGSRLGSVGAARGTAGLTTGLALPSRAMGSVSVGGLGYDVEVGGTGVGLNAQSLRGGTTPGLRGAVFGGTADVGGALDVGGPIQRDTAYAIAGLDFQRSEVARPAFVLPGDTPGLALIDAARNSFGTDLSGYGAETPRVEERLSGFGRLDWQLGDRYALTLRAAGSRLYASDPPALGEVSAALGSRLTASEVQASMNVVARISRRVSAELRVSGDFGDATGEPPRLPPTSFSGRGLTIGGSAHEPFADRRTSPRVTSMLHFALGAHRVKAGVTVASHRFESDGVVGAAGVFAFGDGVDFAGANGAWRGATGSAGSGSYRVTEQAWFFQDAWRVADGLSLNFGLRFDANNVSLAEMTQNAEWLARTGIDNTASGVSTARVAPRIGFRWELGPDRGWVLEGGAGVYNGLPDRRDIGEVLSLDQGLDVRYGVGALGGWPGVPDSAVAPVVGRTISLLGPSFEGPRTRRLSLGLQRDIAAWTGYVRAVYRQTDFMARRRDLNLPLAAIGSDQYGRPLLGTPTMVGSLVAVVPGSNRRFAEFDAVTAIEATGYSEYWGATAGVERLLSRGFSFGAHYTFSASRDNLAYDQRTLVPLPSGFAGSEWSDGVADTDAPHRVIAATEWSATASGAFRIGAVYRLQSGAPFTPGFRDGIDANADGVAGNDAAFVDAALPGIAPLMNAWSCLREGAGQFAERNSCRSDWAHRLDVRAAIRLAGLTGGPLELFIDALNVIPGTSGRVDRALMLVDRAGAITSSPTTGVRTVPYVVNPAFGQLLADRASPMLFRVGLRIGQ